MRGSFEVGAVYTDPLATHYSLIMDGQRPMKMAILAYLHVKPLPLHHQSAWADLILDMLDIFLSVMFITRMYLYLQHKM